MEFVGGWLAVTIIAFFVGCLAGWWVRTLWVPKGGDMNNHHSSNRAPAYGSGISNYAPSYAQQATASGWHGPNDKLPAASAVYKDTNPISDTTGKHIAVPMSMITEQAQQAPALKGPAAAGMNAAGVAVVNALASQAPVKLATAPPASSTRPQHKRDASTASMYDVDELDNEWASLLDMVDTQLAKAGQAPMEMKERQVAVKKLTAVTGTRGVEAALRAAADEVARFRSWNNRPAVNKA